MASAAVARRSAGISPRSRPRATENHGEVPAVAVIARGPSGRRGIDRLEPACGVAWLSGCCVVKGGTGAAGDQSVLACNRGVGSENGMAWLLDRAPSAARGLPPEAQDDIARVVLRLAGSDDAVAVAACGAGPSWRRKLLPPVADLRLMNRCGRCGARTDRAASLGSILATIAAVRGRSYGASGAAFRTSSIFCCSIPTSARASMIRLSSAGRRHPALLHFPRGDPDRGYHSHRLSFWSRPCPVRLAMISQSGSRAYDDYLPLDHWPLDDYRPLHDYGPFCDHWGRLSDVNRTRRRSGNHASCEAQKDQRQH